MRLPSSSQAVLPENWQKAGFGLYIHWPFCAAKCPYCDFNSHVVSHIDQSRWKNAYLSEIERSASETPDRILSSVFFGGGTPSLMNADLVAAIVDKIRGCWTVSNDLEITLEANPTSVEATRFADYRDCGVNRVSMGFQALDNHDLKALGRLHTVEESLSALEIARCAFDRVSFDLIYARQNQKLSDWESELGHAISMAPDHLSLYQLTIEEGTAFGDRFDRGRLGGLPNEDLGADLYHATQDICEINGLFSYEVSNHAKPGQECLHNLIYWNAGDYIGIGPGAHGRLSFGSSRYATDTLTSPAGWLLQVEQTGNGEKAREPIERVDEVAESIMMGLRLTSGISESKFDDILDSGNKINELVAQELLERNAGYIRASDRGRMLLNPVLRHLLT